MLAPQSEEYAIGAMNQSIFQSEKDDLLANALANLFGSVKARKQEEILREIKERGQDGKSNQIPGRLLPGSNIIS